VQWTQDKVVAVQDHDCNKEVWTLLPSQNAVKYQLIPKSADEERPMPGFSCKGLADFSYKAHLDNFEVATKQWY
jgi:hypothetical protein